MTDNVVPIKPPAISKEDGRQVERKWSPLVMKQGYTIVLSCCFTRRSGSGLARRS